MDPDDWDRFCSLHARVEKGLGAAVRAHGLSLTEFRMLRLLAAAPCGEAHMRELTDGLGLDQSTVSRLAARLVEKALIRRASGMTDRRTVHVAITAEGKAVESRAADAYACALGAAFASAADPSAPAPSRDRP